MSDREKPKNNIIGLYMLLLLYLVLYIHIFMT